MTTQAAKLAVQERTLMRKKVGLLRREGITPIHLYGPGIDSQVFQVDTKLLRKTLSVVGYNRPVEVVPDGSGESHLAFVREIQFHPLTIEVVHVDFLRVDMTKKTRVDVPIELVGESPAVRVHGGSMIQAMYTVSVEAIPMEIPATVIVDVSRIDTFDKNIHVRDLEVGQGVAIVTDGDQMVAHVAAPVNAAAVEEAEEGAAPAPATEPERVDDSGDDSAADEGGESDN